MRNLGPPYVNLLVERKSLPLDIRKTNVDSTLTFEVKVEGIEDNKHSPFASPKNKEKEDSQKRKAKGRNGLLRVLP
ncbi:conserved hypothetical protein [Ricinus communis]|uniref:Uncharacterized protein n=1 Tax=Ricinus communis TaxID=3988 RepID=B9RPW0_RICCO|nr:conserved hypothetical protein [Ricinus communis]